MGRQLHEKVGAGTEMRDIDSLRPHPENVSIFGEAEESNEFEGLRKSIQKFGLWEPITIRPDGTILSGHLRVQALKELGTKQVPCRVMQFEAYRDEVVYLVRSNTDRRQLSKFEIVRAFKRLTQLSREEGGVRRRMGRIPAFEGKGKKCGPGSTLSKTRDDAAAVLGVGEREVRSLTTVLDADDVPDELKQAVNRDKIAPTPAANAIRAERKRQGGMIADPAPLKAWTEQRGTKRANCMPTDDASSHEERVAEEARRFKADVAELLGLYQKLDVLLGRRPLKSVIGPTEHQQYASLIRDVALRSSVELESVQGSETVGRQLRLSVVAGGKS